MKMEDKSQGTSKPGPRKKNPQVATATGAPEREKQKGGRKPDPNKPDLVAMAVSLPKPLVETLKSFSTEQYRTPSNQVAYYVTEGMRRDGLLKEEKQAPSASGN